MGQGANHKHHLGLSESDRPRLVLVIWMVLGETFENDQKSNFKLVISRPESDSLARQHAVFGTRAGL